MSARSRESVLDSWWRIGGVLGILFVILFIVGAMALQGNTPMANDSAEKIKTYFSDHPHRYMVGDFLISIAFIFFFLPFASALTSFLGRAEGEPLLSRLAWAGALLFTAVGGATSAVQGNLAYSGAGYADDNLLKTLINMNNYTFTLVVPFTMALLVSATSLVSLRTAVLPKLHAWFGLALSVAAVISSLGILSKDPQGPLGTVGFIAFIAFGIWMLATGGLMARRESTPARAMTPEPA